MSPSGRARRTAQRLAREGSCARAGSFAAGSTTNAKATPEIRPGEAGWGESWSHRRALAIRVGLCPVAA